MNVFAFLKSLDEILYEVVSWLLFYPLTLWRVIRHPLDMMKRAYTEVASAGENRFDDALSPPLLLLLTILVSHAIELSMIGQSVLVREQSGLAGYIKDDTSLILLRMVAFSIFPLVFATRAVRARNAILNRHTLEPEFYAQSYVNAPYALMVSIASTLLQVNDDTTKMIAVVLGGTSIVVFLAFETVWFRREMNLSTWRALGHVLRAYVEAALALSLVAFLIGGDVGL
ncbi:hypothetical protein H8M03_07695 [Sphingomonas sabuli]|uniref:Permease n=1 Tax=Sphingomonas sabuli TaxID=2764186 RepID=A0A7G9KZX8_9SPHN|nr:hypothetical protein [Sphingomonas sabuli]QNM81927.1 hypothetical protein H8M03_07695 [Sphingomonas sabuli]